MKNLLNSICSLSSSREHVELAAKLATIKCPLCLSQLTGLSIEAAKMLAKKKGSLVLDGLKELSAEVARAVACHEGPLHLDGIGTVTDAAAEALAGHTGGSLQLRGLTELTGSDGHLALARRLAGQKGSVELFRLVKLSTPVREVLAGAVGSVRAPALGYPLGSRSRRNASLGEEPKEPCSAVLVNLVKRLASFAEL